MARKVRIQYPGAIYHVMNRGDHREEIFDDDVDRGCFLETLAECCQKTDFQVHAYCLMGNHFHLVVETPKANLSDGMKWLLQTYTSRYNRRHRYFGHLFSGRFRAPIVDGSGNGYLRTACEYVHLNPIRAQLVGDDEPLRRYAWSSYPQYLQPTRAPWLRVDRVLGEYGIPGDTPAGRDRLEEVMEQRRFQADGRDWKALRRGWCLGSLEFRQELLAQVGGYIGPNHFGDERRESAEQKADRILSQEAETMGLRASQLPSGAGAQAARLRIARRIRQETTMSLRWIAARLGFSSWKYLSNLLTQQPTDDGSQQQLGL